MKHRVLVVDDHQDMLRMLKRLLETELQVEVLTSASASKAIETVKKEPVDLAIVDVKMPKKDGITLLREAKEIDSNLIVIILTGYGTVEMAVEALKQGAYDFLTKPVNNERLVHTVKRALEYRRVLDEKSALERKIAEETLRRELIGESRAIKELLERLSAVAVTDETILIRGETGTGKELAARTIHRLSSRAEGPFITVNCPAIPESILESELFGYRKGAFTSAVTDKKGLFEAAHGGTIFLDEIGDIPSSVQTKLLRVLQEKEFKPLGDTENVKVDVRVIASTNQDLETKIEKGEFREDLYYRLNVITLRMPSLNERAEDIPLLANHFLKEYSVEYGKDISGFDSEAIDYLINRNWKGNVRELQNVVKRAVIFTKGSRISRADLESPVIENPCADDVIAGLLEKDYKTAKQKVLERFTREYVSHL
ncbi:MAG: sigma-54-dependent Fis family transcriptional regulator, partial [Nitrospirae bacterium]